MVGYLEKDMRKHDGIIGAFYLIGKVVILVYTFYQTLQSVHLNGWFHCT